MNYPDDFINKVIQGDCLEIMKQMPDKCVDLVLTDPPYGLGNRLSDGGGKLKNTPMAVLYRESTWEDILPPQEVFDEIFRISKNQIIFGGNYFNLPPTRGFIVWDKKQSPPTLSSCEYIWTSFDYPSKIIRKESTDLSRQHPTQKPVDVIGFCINYAETVLHKNVGTILDPFLGSGTTARACKNLHRNFIGIEISEKYCEIARQRLGQEILF